MADEETKTEETKEETPAEAPAQETKAEEVKAEEPAKESNAADAPLDKAPKAEKAAPSGKFAALIKQIEELSVLELADLVKELEDRFGVSASAPMAMMAGAAAAGAPAAEEKSSYTVHLVDGGAQKIAVIKAVREIMPDLGLKEAKDLVDAAPKDVKKDMPKADAEAAKAKLEAAGAKVELK